MGEVVWLGSYPVKSMRGESLAEALLDESGVAGDRRYALIDAESGLVASAKDPGPWRVLLTMSARYPAPGAPAEVTLPDGTTVRADDPDADAALSRAVGRPVRLVRAGPDGPMRERVTPPPGTATGNPPAIGAPGMTFVDSAPIYVLTTATLDALAQGHPRGELDPRRLRPNIIVRIDGGRPFEENTWPGRTLSIGGASLWMIAQCPRCLIPTLAQGDDLGEDPDVLRTMARLNRVQVGDLGVLTCAGAYARVERSGPVRVGDTAAML